MTRAGVAGALRLAGWTALLVALGRVLLALGSGTLAVPVTSRHALRVWVDETPPPDMAVALLRLAALAAVAYLLAATVLTVAARLVRIRGLTALAQHVTPGVVRRLASGGGGLGLVLGSVIGAAPAPGPAGGPAPSTVAAAPDAAATMTRRPDTAPGDVLPPGADDTATMTRDTALWPDDTATMTRDGPPLARHEAPADTAGGGLAPSLAAGSAPAVPARFVPPRAPAPSPAAARAGPIDDSTWVVEPGDSLWSIAADVLTPRGGPAPSDRRMGRYWRRLIAANRSQLVDPANPDLILPGQRLTLPRPDG